MKITVCLKKYWRDSLSSRFVDELRSMVVKDPAERESVVLSSEQMHFVRLLDEARVVTRFMITAEVEGSPFDFGECSDRVRYVAVRQDVSGKPIQHIQVFGDSLDWVVCAMNHVCSGGHLAAPFVMLPVLRMGGTYEELLLPFERLLMSAILARSGWSSSKAARSLGLWRGTVSNMLRRLGLHGVRELKLANVNAPLSGLPVAKAS